MTTAIIGFDGTVEQPLITKTWDMLEKQKELIEGLDSTLFSLTSFRLNQKMKIFTLISVIFLPMTLNASVLGMNVPLPGAGGMGLYVRHRGWI